MKRVRLLRILAPVVNGVDLSKFRVGDVVQVSDGIASMLVQERWAEMVPDPIAAFEETPVPGRISPE
jgi:hypothetical protein